MYECSPRWTPRLSAVATVLALATPAIADVPISEAARHHFEEGVRYLGSKDPDRYERAYVEFKTAHADSPSWQMLGNLGLVAQELERYGEGIDAFRGYLEGGGKKLSTQERKQFERDLSLLESDIATLTLETDPQGAWIIDERLPEMGPAIINRYGPLWGAVALRIRPGHHRIHAELSGNAGEIWEINPAAKTSDSHKFALQMVRPPVEAPVRREEPVLQEQVGIGDERGTSALRVASYTTLGLGSVGLGLGTWFFLEMHRTSSDAEHAFSNCGKLRSTPGVCDVGRLNAAGQPDDYAVKA